MKCLFLYNPNSGKGKLERKLPLIRKLLSKRYSRIEVVATKSGDDLEDRVRNADCDVIFSGGDGTFHRVLQAAEGKRLGYLPSGTVNDVARSLRIPRNVKGAIGVILKGHAVRLDCMKVGETLAAYVAAAGAFTETTYRTPQAQKRLLGPLAYALHGLKHGLPLPVFPLKIVCDGTTLETDAVLVLVLNGRSVAGFPVNRRASMRDGKLEVAVIRQAKRPGFFRRAGALFSIGALFLFGIRFKKRDVLFLQGKKIDIATNRDLVWDLDGERGPSGDLSVELLKNHIFLYV